MYFLMVSSEDLLSLAYEKSGYEYFKNKLEEERGHSEWLSKDIESLEGSILGSDYDAAAIAGAQYYYIRHVSPLMLLGYMAVLECNPMPMAEIDRLESLYGKLPTLRYHAEHDIKHGDEVIDEIYKITDNELLSKVLFNGHCTAKAIGFILKSRFKGVNNALH